MRHVYTTVVPNGCSLFPLISYQKREGQVVRLTPRTRRKNDSTLEKRQIALAQELKMEQGLFAKVFLFNPLSEQILVTFFYSGALYCAKGCLAGLFADVRRWGRWGGW